MQTLLFDVHVLFGLQYSFHIKAPRANTLSFPQTWIDAQLPFRKTKPASGKGLPRARLCLLNGRACGRGSTPMVPFAPPILVYFTGDWDVYWEYGVLTHSHVCLMGSPTSALLEHQAQDGHDRVQGEPVVHTKPA